MSREKELAMAAIGSLVLTCVVVIYGLVSFAVVFATLWGWFVAPIFGFLELTVAQSFGLAFLFCLLSKKQPIRKPKEQETDWAALVLGLLSPWIILFFAFLFKVMFL